MKDIFKGVAIKIVSLIVIIVILCGGGFLLYRNFANNLSDTIKHETANSVEIVREKLQETAELNTGSYLCMDVLTRADSRKFKDWKIPFTEKSFIVSYDGVVKAGIKAGGTNTTPTAITKSNAYEKFLEGQEYLDDQKVPLEGRVAGVSSAFYKFLKLDPSFVKNSYLGQKVAFKGQVGEVDGVKIIKMPKSYFPDGCPFFITHPSVTVSPDKLQDYKIHDNPPGINGNLVEGRVRYDAFVLDARKNGIYAYQEKTITVDDDTE